MKERYSGEHGVQVMQAPPHLFNQNLRLLLQMYDNGKYNFNRDEPIRISADALTIRNCLQSSRSLFPLQINKNFS